MNAIAVAILSAVAAPALVAFGMVIAILTLSATDACSAVMPNTKEMPAIRPETAKDGQQHKGTCIEATTRRRFLMMPDGRAVLLGGPFTVYEACK